MKKVLGFLLVLIFVFSSSDAFAYRRHVYIHKRPPHVSTQPIVSAPLMFVPPIAIFYDLERRTSCQGDYLGLGGAGFDAQPQTGNFLVPAIYRSACQAAPK